MALVIPRLRILMVGREDRPVFWGVGSLEHIMLHVAEALSEDHHVVVASVGRGSYIADPAFRLEHNPLEDYGLYGAPAPLGNVYRLPGENFERVALDAAGDITDLAPSLAIDVVAVHDDPTLASMLAIPVVFIAHSSPRFWGLRHPERLRASLAASAGLAATSRHLCDTLSMRSLRDDVAYLPLFAPPAALDTPLVTPPHPTVLMASRLSADSGVLDLCALWRRHAPSPSELLVVDFEDPSMPTSEVEEIKAFVRSTPMATLYPSWAAPSVGSAVYASSTVLAVCALDDAPSSLAVLEARAAGCRVVGFSHPALEEVAGESALLVSRGDHRSLYLAISKALEEDALSQRKAERDSVALSHPLSRTVGVYEDLVASAAR